VRAKRNLRGQPGQGWFLIAAASALSLGASAAAAVAAEPGAETPGGADVEASALLERPGERLARSIESDRAIERKVQEVQAVGDEPSDAPTDAPEASTVAGVPQAALEAIAACESGGDPTAVSSDGTYRGKYQFDRSTWASVAGSGDPAAAPESEQDYRAALLYERTGGGAWPNCG
jgi:soluble lytic murein transglycosylase-like protein